MDWDKFSKTAGTKVLSKLDIKEQHLRTIKQGTKQPVRSLQVMQARESVLSMLYLCTTTYMGVQNSKTEAMLYQKGAQFIIDNFSWISVPEIDQAFGLASAKRINIDLTAYYGTFSLDLIGSLLRAYQKYRNRVLAEVQKQINEKAKQEKEAEDLAMKNELAKAEFCTEVLKWVAMANDGFYPFEHWSEIPSVKARAAFKAEAIAVEADHKKEIWKRAGVEAMRKIEREKAGKVGRGELTATHFKMFKKEVLAGYVPKTYEGKREKIYSQLLLWEFVKPKDND